MKFPPDGQPYYDAPYLPVTVVNPTWYRLVACAFWGGLGFVALVGLKHGVSALWMLP